MSAGHSGLERSVMDRLILSASRRKQDPNALLRRFVIERFLHRLGGSEHASTFVVKGATLMPLWLGEQARPTRDADLAGYGDLNPNTLQVIFESVMTMDVEPDAVVFDPSSIRISPIREGDEYHGYRVTAIGRIGRSRIPLQVDIGIGDAISPPPATVELPTLLEFSPPRVRAYRPETSISEKFSAMVTLAGANSRMKDYYDIDRLAANLAFNGPTLRTAIEKTFERRGLGLPNEIPVGLSSAFALSADKAKQWLGFASRFDASPSFVDVVGRVRDFVMPVITAQVSTWPPGGPWVS
jgi:hypothetical protein